MADANKQWSIPGKDWDKKRDPETASRAVKEYLAALDDAAFGAASEVTPKFISPSDPAAQWTGAMRGPPSTVTALFDLGCVKTCTDQKLLKSYSNAPLNYPGSTHGMKSETLGARQKRRILEVVEISAPSYW